MRKSIIARRTIKQQVQDIILNNRRNLILFTLLMIVVSLFIVSALLQNKGTFTITTARADMIKYGLVLSDEPEFKRPRQELLSAPVVNMWNITQTDLPSGIDDIDGTHNGDNYLAYTFYVKNIGEAALTYKPNLDLNQKFKDVDDAMRIMVYFNGSPTVYAKQKNDGSGPEPDTEPFSAATRLLSLSQRPIDVGQVDKYTVVVWLEGEDPECVNDILGGFVKMTMSFDVLQRSSNPEDFTEAT